ncbi:hypothetical protein J3R82DRAFT_5206 [Butyriboletus roseoflavus]|nr:hypothetical protein J3R82DRAFT_5206 [Butyriboletus roseoflavus]
MYIRFSALLPVAALAAVVAAAPSALDVRASSSSCNTGSIQCCTQTSSSTDTSSSSLTSVLGLLGIVSSRRHGSHRDWLLPVRLSVPSSPSAAQAIPSTGWSTSAATPSLSTL